LDVIKENTLSHSNEISFDKETPKSQDRDKKGSISGIHEETEKELLYYALLELVLKKFPTDLDNPVLIDDQDQLGEAVDI